MISKPLIERILDSYLNVLYEKQSKGITNDQWTNAELLREIWLRANNKSKWYLALQLILHPYNATLSYRWMSSQNFFETSKKDQRKEMKTHCGEIKGSTDG